MKKEKNLLNSIFLLSILTLLTSCNNYSNQNIKVISPSETLYGDLYIGENSSPTKYSPNGYYIQAIKPEYGIWQRLQINNNEKQIEPDIFFHEDRVNHTYIYDSLTVGQYNVKYFSELNDTIEQIIDFNQSIRLEFPAKLERYYKKKKIKDFEIEMFSKNDTLQFLFLNKGCFGGVPPTLLEFYFNHKNEIVFRKQIINESGSQTWLYSENYDYKENLISFLNSLKGLDENDENFCSSEDDYIFRKKGTNIIYCLKDKSCRLMRAISKLMKKS